ncbi:hypothetical protein ACFQ3S_04995 [Mucilaginibacter terrae]|uniref:hypothetical protein n=1 Tax=Mucilaginibacter terrae TaxID=1955052 RepID=UPI003643DF05
MSNNIFTGGVFPNKIFNKEFDYYISIEFEVFFKNEFEEAFEKFFFENQIKNMNFSSLDKNHSFNFILSNKDVRSVYLSFLKNTIVPEALPQEHNYYTLLTDFVLFNEIHHFAFYANRHYDIGILAYNQPLKIDMFKEIALEIPMKKYFEELQFKSTYYNKILKQFENKENYLLK